MINQQLPLRRAILGAGAVIGTAAASMFFSAPGNAVPPPGPTVTFDAGVLTITGTTADDGLVVGSTTAGGSTLGTITLNGKEVLAGSVLVPDVSFIAIDGGGGNNVLKFDESSGTKLPPGEFVGGDGRDAMTGGSGADSFVSGAGIDRIVGGPGADTVSTGDGSDEFTWNPWDGNDRVDGDAEKDTRLFNAGPEELVNLFENGSRAVLSLPPDPFSPVGTPPRLELSVAGFELMKINVADFGQGSGGQRVLSTN